MPRICFVSDEIYPTTPGGAGALLFNVAGELLTQGFEVIFLLDIPENAYNQFADSDRLLLPASENCRTYQVDALCAGIPYQESDFISRYAWKSFRLDFACRQVYQAEQPKVIEFVDFCGPAYHALSAKVCNASYQNSLLTVRFHGPIEMIDRHARVSSIDLDRYSIYSLERQSFRLAEMVLFPTPGYLSGYDDIDQAHWYGEAHYSRPVVETFPRRGGEDPHANIVMFYGRLFSVKGADLFVDAAVRVLESDPESRLEFYLVGYDSMDPPLSGLQSYQEYLLLKIPRGLRARFTFTGFLARPDVEKLLPRVRCVVFPSYYESFCFAAHELSQAGIPMILSDIPAFWSSFKPESEALFFDGTAGDLARQIMRLDRDDGLRKKLSSEKPVSAVDTVQFYLQPSPQSWIFPKAPAVKPTLLACIAYDQGDEDLVQKTLESLSQNPLEGMRILLLKRYQTGKKVQPATWFLGNLYVFEEPDGQPVSCFDVQTLESLIILRAGDELAADFIPRSLEILSRQPQIAFVGSWKTIRNDSRKWVYTFPLDAMLELAPFEALSFLNRCVMRTPANQLLIDLFDRRADILSEVAYLWQLDNNEHCGILIPEPLVSQQAESIKTVGLSALSYLMLQDQPASRLNSLKRYLVALTSHYPKPLLPFQAIWAEKSGLPGQVNLQDDDSAPKSMSIRQRLVGGLSKNERAGRSMLVVLNWLWSGYQSLRKLWESIRSSR